MRIGGGGGSRTRVRKRSAWNVYVHSPFGTSRRPPPEGADERPASPCCFAQGSRAGPQAIPLCDARPDPRPGVVRFGATPSPPCLRVTREEIMPTCPAIPTARGDSRPLPRQDAGPYRRDDRALPGAVPGQEVLHALFEARADARPKAIAVVFGREEATYSDLESRANRLARHLRSRGVGRGSVVAMLLPRSVDAYATLLGILKAGAAYVPIDPEYPADRVAYILEDSGAGALVTTADLAGRYEAFGGVVVRVDADRDAIAVESPARLPRGEVGVGPRDLCYVIYTSGSTGRPKGVMIEHRSACHLVRAEGGIYQPRPDDRVYQGFCLAFDASVEEIWLAFHAGAARVAATPEMARAGPDLS